MVIREFEDWCDSMVSNKLRETFSVAIYLFIYAIKSPMAIRGIVLLPNAIYKKVFDGRSIRRAIEINRETSEWAESLINVEFHIQFKATTHQMQAAETNTIKHRVKCFIYRISSGTRHLPPVEYNSVRFFPYFSFIILSFVVKCARDLNRNLVWFSLIRFALPVCHVPCVRDLCVCERARVILQFYSAKIIRVVSLRCWIIF